VRDLFEYRDLGLIEARGFASAVRVSQVLGATAVESRFEAMRDAQVAPLVGRGEEVELLLRRWMRANDGEGQIVLLSGEPGIGKSRLASFLHQRLSTQTHTLLRYSCSEQHRDTALYPIILHAQRAAGFKREDATKTRLNKLEMWLA
jgi:MoxR-like ATPase